VNTGRRPLVGSGVSRGLVVASAATLMALAVFVVSMTAAALTYPGGSWSDPGSSGFSLVRNFWCDLLRGTAINGADNALARRSASIAFSALALGLWPFWWVAAAPLPPGRRARLVWLGTSSAACLATMAVLPTDRYSVAHGVVALSGAALGMWAAATSVAERLPGEAALALRRVSGALTLVAAAANAILYVHVAYLRGPENIAQPLVQKLATLCLVTWMLSTVRSAQRSA
jgi:hypothetical protein